MTERGNKFMEDKKAEIVQILDKDYILFSRYGKFVLIGPLLEDNIAHNTPVVGEFLTEDEARKHIAELNAA